MRTSTLSALLLLTAGLVIAAPAPLPRRKSDRDNELSKLQGEWRVTVAHLWQDVGWSKITALGDFAIQGDRLTWDVGTSLEVRDTIRLHPGTNLKGIDFIPERSGQPTLAAYHLEGDTLTIVYAPPGGPRPESMEEGRPNECRVAYRRRRP
jgi:uncharacterized protein (TIGR03067 family)